MVLRRRNIGYWHGVCYLAGRTVPNRPKTGATERVSVATLVRL